MIESSPLNDKDTDPDGEGQLYVLHLFVTGASLYSTRAIKNIRHICDQYLSGNYSLEIIDVHQQREVAEEEQLIALPLLIKRFPLPERRLIGDLSDTRKVLNGLGLAT
ncbi:circadian clock protein KaiB [Spirosoma aureum]|uniref:Circadian clock protein KaiB n=1 Tax=Spirosoma aureum TaxID=2692134 RepID=A0A6G9AP54_9BACT|nr:circadian clock KaiB family protein [Spirosoma aureum]QIP14272.1 circadian clock protein KaiB [Spirosoma aureum]